MTPDRIALAIAGLTAAAVLYLHTAKEYRERRMVRR